MILLGQYTTAQREEALEDAERRLDTKGHTPTVELAVKNVKVMPVLFQPREFIGVDEKNNRATVDDEHVKSLKRAVEIYGEIEPPLVIKLKGPGTPTGFVIVDGHHTLEAYKLAKKTAIKCVWFPGTVREALDESMRRNGKDKKALRQAERQQEGWKRVLMGGWTAKQVEQVCGVSVRQVKNMRQVVRVAEERSRRGKAFRERLKEHTKYNGLGLDATPLEMLKSISWQVAKAIRRNASPEEKTTEEKAAALSRALRNKMERKLSKEPHVTALALKLYDAKLPRLLLAEFTAMDTAADTTLIEAARQKLTERNEAAKERGRRAARTRARQEAEAAVARAGEERLSFNKDTSPEERRRVEEKYWTAKKALEDLMAAQKREIAQEQQRKATQEAAVEDRAL